MYWSHCLRHNQPTTWLRYYNAVIYDDPEIATNIDRRKPRVIRRQAAKMFKIMPAISQDSLDVPAQYHVKLVDVLSHFSISFLRSFPFSKNVMLPFILNVMMISW